MGEFIGWSVAYVIVGLISLPVTNAILNFCADQRMTTIQRFSTLSMINEYGGRDFELVTKHSASADKGFAFCIHLAFWWCWLLIALIMLPFGAIGRLIKLFS